jgi:hypothetical protein
MFRITEDPSSVSLVQCLEKNYKNEMTTQQYTKSLNLKEIFSVAGWLLIGLKGFLSTLDK